MYSASFLVIMKDKNIAVQKSPRCCSSSDQRWITVWDVVALLFRIIMFTKRAEGKWAM